MCTIVGSCRAVHAGGGGEWGPSIKSLVVATVSARSAMTVEPTKASVIRSANDAAAETATMRGTR